MRPTELEEIHRTITKIRDEQFPDLEIEFLEAADISERDPADEKAAGACGKGRLTRTLEIVFAIEPGDGEPQPRPGEYDELRWCDPADLPEPLADVARQMTPLLASGDATS